MSGVSEVSDIVRSSGRSVLFQAVAQEAKSMFLRGVQPSGTLSSVIPFFGPSILFVDIVV